MNAALRYFLPLYLLCYFAAAFFWPSWRAWKMTGKNPYVFAKSESAHDFIGRLFRLTLIACALVIGVYSFWPEGYLYLSPIAWLQSRACVYAGLGLLALALIWTLVAQAQMGASWRIGIDARHAAPLVQRGVFHISRNPVFLGMRATLLGLFLLLPNAVSFALLLLGDALLQIQVRLEEEFLRQTHGAAYANYCRQVRRWL